MVDDPVHVPPTGSALEIRCPHCGDADLDDFEALRADEIHELRCSACGEHFLMLVAGCVSCEEEVLITWPAAPTPRELARVRCLHCGTGWLRHEEDLRGMGDWR